MSIRRRIANLFYRSELDREVDAELQSHIEMHIEDNLADGMSPERARREALLKFGNPVALKDEVTAMDAALVLESFWSDCRYACRQLRKSPGFAVTAVMTLALAIGANAIVFGVLNGLILRPLNVPRSESLYGSQYGDGAGWQSYPNYVDLRDRNRSFEGLAAFGFAFFVLDAGKDPVASTGFSVSAQRALSLDPLKLLREE